jgi:hypothetical protein
MNPRSSPWLVVTATSALFLYVVASGEIAFSRWVFTGFCDSAEQDCALPWTTARVATWVLWGLAGLVLAATTVAAFRAWARRATIAGLVAGPALAVGAAALYRTL